MSKKNLLILLALHLIPSKDMPDYQGMTFKYPLKTLQKNMENNLKYKYLNKPLEGHAPRPKYYRTTYK